MSDFMKEIISPKLLLSLLMAIIAVVLYFSVKVLTRKYFARTGERGKAATLKHIFVSILRALIILLAVLMILQVNGVNVSALVSGLGIVSAIIGLALQDYLKDIIMGIHIITDGFFSVGDCIEYDGRYGIVTDMTLKTTKLRDIDDGSIITICNRNISDMRRLSGVIMLDIPLSYKEDVQNVHRVLSLASQKIASLPDVDSCEYKGTQEFAESAVLYRFRIAGDCKYRPDIRRAALRVIQEDLDRAGMRIPYSQLDVHCDMQSGEDGDK